MKGLFLLLTSCMIACTPQENPPTSPTNPTPQTSPTTAPPMEDGQLAQLIENGEHLMCQKDGDCTKISTSVCGISFPTNINHQHHTQHHFDNTERAVECKPSAQSSDDFYVICQHQQCTLVDTNL